MKMNDCILTDDSILLSDIRWFLVMIIMLVLLLVGMIVVMIGYYVFLGRVEFSVH